MRLSQNSCKINMGQRGIVAGDCPSNEELALRVQVGDEEAAELLISQNEGYITNPALEHSERYELEDLKHNGSEAAKRFDPFYGAKLLTYATPAIEAAMTGLFRKAIHKARLEAEVDPGCCSMPQTAWLDEKDLAERFICEVAALIKVLQILSDDLEKKEE